MAVKTNWKIKWLAFFWCVPCLGYFSSSLAQEDHFNSNTSQNDQSPSQEAQAVQASGDVYHQLSVIVGRAWPAPVINPQEEEKIDKQLKLMKMVPKLVPCAGKMEAVLTKMKSAIAHYKVAEKDRSNVEELKAGREDNQEAARLLREVAKCINEIGAFARTRPQGMRQRQPSRYPTNLAQSEQQQQQQWPPTAPPIPNQLAQTDSSATRCPPKPLATTSWTLGYAPPGIQPQWKTLHYGGPGWRNNIKPSVLARMPLCSNPSESRDEFPFASTYEGASAHVECVPVIEQNAQRDLMNRFYREEKLHAGDPFLVEVAP